MNPKPLNNDADRKAFARDASMAIADVTRALVEASMLLTEYPTLYLREAFYPNITGELYSTAKISIAATHYDGKPTPSMQAGMTIPKRQVELVIRGWNGKSDNEACIRLIYDFERTSLTPIQDQGRR